MNRNDVSDPSNGYESVADRFISGRSQSGVGVETVRAWAKELPSGGAILDLGCGSGNPISKIFVEGGFALYGVDASASMIAAFRANFPSARAECSTIEDSPFFARTFDGVVAWGLIFLLPPEVQSRLIQKVSQVLNPGGKFLFTSPSQICEWPDALTGRKSISLGARAYRGILTTERLTLIGELHDEGDNHYYLASKASP